MGTVGITLTRPAWVHMDVCDDRHPTRLAYLPQVAEIAPIEPHDSAVKRVRVQVIIENKVHDSSPTSFTMSEQERTTFPPATVPALAQLYLQPTPQKP